jgi:hypothetical protein
MRPSQDFTESVNELLLDAAAREVVDAFLANPFIGVGLREMLQIIGVSEPDIPAFLDALISLRAG